MFLCYLFGLWVHALFSSLSFCYQYQCNWLPGKIRPRNDLLCVEWDVKTYSTLHTCSHRGNHQLDLNVIITNILVSGNHPDEVIDCVCAHGLWLNLGELFSNMTDRWVDSSILEVKWMLSQQSWNLHLLFVFDQTVLFNWIQVEYLICCSTRGEYW